MNKINAAAKVEGVAADEEAAEVDGVDGVAVDEEGNEVYVDVNGKMPFFFLLIRNLFML